MKSLLLIPASLCLGFAEAKTESDNLSFLITTPRVDPIEDLCAKPERADCVAVAGAEDDDQLAGLSRQLDALSKSLLETKKSVNEMSEQRDAAREDAARFQKNETTALRELGKLKAALKAARSEGAEWKRKAVASEEKLKAGAMAHAELQQFRGELQGALKEFQALKGDFGKARSELQDPIERATLKKSVAGLQKDQKRLTEEVKLALQAKSRAGQDLEKLKVSLKETEGKVSARMREAKVLGEELKGVRAEKVKAVADVKALTEQAVQGRKALAGLERERDELKKGLEARSKDAREAAKATEKLRTLVTGLEKESAGTQKELKDLRSHLHKMEQAVDAKEKELVKAAQAAKELAKVKTGLAAREKDLASVKASAKKAEEGLKQAEAGRKDAAARLVKLEAGMKKANEQLVFVTKAKSGLEELLFRKTDELKALKAEIKKLRNSVKKDEQTCPNQTEKVAEIRQD